LALVAAVTLAQNASKQRSQTDPWSGRTLIALRIAGRKADGQSPHTTQSGLSTRLAGFGSLVAMDALRLQTSKLLHPIIDCSSSSFATHRARRDLLRQVLAALDSYAKFHGVHLILTCIRKYIKCKTEGGIKEVQR